MKDNWACSKKKANRIIHAAAEIRRCDNAAFIFSFLKPRYLISFFVCTSCLLTRLVRMHSIPVSFPDYCLYAIITVISPHFLPSRPAPPPPTSTTPLNSHSDLWLLILYLSARRTGAREMTCFRLGWKDTRARAHTQAPETASSSQCNYGETEQSVTHLSAARIRARVLLWHWRGKAES